MNKLFVNGIQIGNYKDALVMLKVAFNMEVIKHGVKSVKWEGNTLNIKTED